MLCDILKMYVGQIRTVITANTNVGRGQYEIQGWKRSCVCQVLF